MDGVLLIDKPAGPTSHDVVARIRHVTRERRVGHTGTLDPLATGLLPLVLGSATRLSSYLTGGLKTYDATVRFGFATDTDDAAGKPTGTVVDVEPDATAVRAALATFLGAIEQTPPTHSAKRIEGRRAYDVARSNAAVALTPVTVTVSALEMLEVEGDRVRLTVTATAGFYVRALARDLGARLGCGGHLASLRRIAAGRFHVADAIGLADAERLGAQLHERLLHPAEAVGDLASVTVTALGLERAIHGNPLNPVHLTSRALPITGPGAHLIRILDGTGRLVALAHARGGALHPSVVLG